METFNKEGVRMKVIDLINDLFDYRGLQPDKLPKKIRFNNNEFVFKDSSYYHENGINIMRYVDHTVDLRVEVEVLEEDKEMEKGIKPFEEYWEEIEMAGCDTVEAKIVYLDRLSKLVIELTEEVRELKKGK